MRLVDKSRNVGKYLVVEKALIRAQIIIMGMADVVLRFLSACNGTKRKGKAEKQKSTRYASFSFVATHHFIFECLPISWVERHCYESNGLRRLLLI